MTSDGLIESGAPFRESALLLRQVRIFVRNVVHPAHKSIERGQGVTLRLRQEKKGVVEIAVGGSRDTVAFVVRFRSNRARPGRSMPRPYNCGRRCFLR